MVGSEKIEPGQLTANQRFRHSDLVTDFVTVILSQSEGLGKMAVGILKYAYDRSSQLIGVIWVRSQFVAVSCCGPKKDGVNANAVLGNWPNFRYPY